MRYPLLIALLVATILAASDRSLAEAVRTDTNIITGLDVSASIDAEETQLEFEGMARAIRSPQFISAVEGGRFGRIGFAVFIWAESSRSIFAGWRMIASADDARALADEMATLLQDVLHSGTKGLGSLTDVSAAMEYAEAMLDESPFIADRAIVNIVSDGEDNVGEGPQRVRDRLVASDVTINGVLLGSNPDLMDYYHRHVIGGPSAFVLAASNRDDLANVVAQKFLMEIVLRVEQAHRGGQ